MYFLEVKASDALLIASRKSTMANAHNPRTGPRPRRPDSWCHGSICWWAKSSLISSYSVAHFTPQSALRAQFCLSNSMDFYLEVGVNPHQLLYLSFEFSRGLWFGKRLLDPPPAHRPDQSPYSNLPDADREVRKVAGCFTHAV